MLLHFRYQWMWAVQRWPSCCWMRPDLWKHSGRFQVQLQNGILSGRGRADLYRWDWMQQSLNKINDHRAAPEMYNVKCTMLYIFRTVDIQLFEWRRVKRGGAWVHLSARVFWSNMQRYVVLIYVRDKKGIINCVVAAASICSKYSLPCSDGSCISPRYSYSDFTVW